VDVSNDVLPAEREHLILARRELKRMREHTTALLDNQTTWGNDELTTRALAASLAARYEQLLDDGTTPLFFGRLDYHEPREVFHVGRRHVTGGDGEPVVVDWRAPISEPFYRASATDPMGLLLRRRFGFRDGVLTAYEDDRLDRPTGASALLVEDIERPRTGPMRDIVATIQPEQDQLVRAPLADTICVQGAPGTGKTAVGLHRAAYLLYAHRQRLATSGVLIVGPNKAFLSYVQEVLPALGETRVTQVTAEQLAPKVSVRSTDSESAAVLKGDARMARVLERALWLRTVRATEPLLHVAGGRRWRVHPDQVRELERAVRGRKLAWGTSRKALAAALAAAVVRQREEAGTAMSDRAIEILARSAGIKTYVDKLWPPVTPTGLLIAVLSDAEMMAAAADGVLTDDEQKLLVWEMPPATPGRARWSRADLPLLDEAAGLVERGTGYAHVIVDEAQDLSAMQLRSIGRRCMTGSATVLGDLAQATTAWASGDWSHVLSHLGKPDGTVQALTIGYRVPRDVLDFANRLLPAIAPVLPPSASLRHVPGALELQRVAPDDLEGAAATAVRRRHGHGSIAVVSAVPAHLEVVAKLLSKSDITAAHLTDEGAWADVTLVPAELVKGLEFDHVVLLEPAELVASGAFGLRLLYVALTRAVTSLIVVHAQDLPEELA
jgi:DNA helicase IV